ncbi:MAG: ABC transporter permease [Candidatus Omnitrophica bacterium]|nr:ABC transporter permease [Candidatus Omnitrophota bacterium]
MWKEFKKNKLALVSFWILFIFYFLAIFADFFAPYRYDDEDIEQSFAPPTKIYFLNLKEKIYQPHIYAYKYRRNQYYMRVYEPDKNKAIPIKFFIRGFKYKLLGIIPLDIHLFGVSEGRIYLLGADLYGRDIFSRLLYGARISLSIGLVGVLISFFLGLIIGGISGYFGGALDTILMRFIEILMMLPAFYIMLALRASFPPSVSSTQVYLLIIVILSLIGWAYIARVIRGMALSLKEQDFVLAAKASCIGSFKIITRHILPHTFSYVIAAICLSIPGYILGEAALSLIGLGIQEPQASWGNMLALAVDIVSIKFYPWILFPGVCVVVVTLCFNIIGDTLRDILDPKRKIF